MALARFSFSACMLLLSLVVVAAASDYGYGLTPDLQNSKPNSDYVYPPPTKVEEKHQMTPSAADYSYTPNSKPSGEETKPAGGYSYTPPPNVEKQKPEEKENTTPSTGDYGYASKPSSGDQKPNEKEKQTPKPYIERQKPAGDYGYVPYAPPPEVEEKKSNDKETTPAAGDYTYGPKPNVEEQKPKEKQPTKPYVEKPKPAGYNGYAPKPSIEVQKAEEKGKQTGNYPSQPYVEGQKRGENKKQTGSYSNDASKPFVRKPQPEINYHESSTHGFRKQLSVGCEGLVLCKSGPRFYPIKGAKAKITCVTVNEYGYEIAPSSTYTSDTNEKGYFLMPLPRMQFDSKYLKFTNCKAYIENISSETCKVPVDDNKWRNGAYLSSYRILNAHNMKLYSIAPFIYTEQHAAATPTGY